MSTTKKEKCVANSEKTNFFFAELNEHLFSTFSNIIFHSFEYNVSDEFFADPWTFPSPSSFHQSMLHAVVLHFYRRHQKVCSVSGLRGTKSLLLINCHSSKVSRRPTPVVSFWSRNFFFFPFTKQTSFFLSTSYYRVNETVA